MLIDGAGEERNSTFFKHQNKEETMNIHRRFRIALGSVLVSAYSGIRTSAQDAVAGLRVATFLLTGMTASKGSVTIKSNTLRNI